MAVAPGAAAAVILGIFGLLIGSFANVVIYRVPEGRSIVRPPSGCPACGARVRSRDNIPVISWLFLRGRCRECQAPISLRYPVVEALVGLLFAGIGLRFGISWTGVGEAALAGGLVVLAFIDLEHLLLPRKIVYATLTVVAVVFVAGAATGSHGTACWWPPFRPGAVGVFFAINFVPQGHGLRRRSVGAAHRFRAWVAGSGYAFLGFMVASVLGSVVGVTMIALGKAGRRTPSRLGRSWPPVRCGPGRCPVVNWYLGQIH